MNEESFVMSAIRDKLFSKMNDNEILHLCNGEDPPDFIVLTGEHKIGIEVTQCGSASFEGKRITPSKSITNPIIEYSNLLDKSLGPRIDENYSITMIIEGPINNFRAFKKSLKLELEKYINDKRYIYLIDEDIAVNDVLITLSPYMYPRDFIKKKISCITGLKSGRHIADIKLHMITVINDAIEKKTKKMQLSKHDLDEKWLAILNTYFLADEFTFRGIAEEGVNNNFFDKILIVTEEGQCIEL